MQSEKERHNKTGPERISQPAQYKETQKRISRVQQDAAQVVAPGGRPENLPVQRMRQPRQRVPVRCFRTGECPFKCFPPQTLLNVPIAGDVVRIVITDKLVMDSGPKGRK